MNRIFLTGFAASLLICVSASTAKASIQTANSPDIHATIVVMVMENPGGGGFTLMAQGAPTQIDFGPSAAMIASGQYLLQATFGSAGDFLAGTIAITGSTSDGSTNYPSPLLTGNLTGFHLEANPTPEWDRLVFTFDYTGGSLRPLYEAVAQYGGATDLFLDTDFEIQFHSIGFPQVTFSNTAPVVPEPGSLVIMGNLFALAVFGASRRKLRMVRAARKP